MRRLPDLVLALVAALTFLLQSQPAQARWVWPAFGAQGEVTATPECGPGQSLAGFIGHAGLWTDQIGLICTEIQSDGTIGRLLDTHEFFGGSGGGEATAFCGTNTRISSAVIWLSGDRKKVHSITLECIDLDGKITLSIFGSRSDDYAARTEGATGTKYRQTCPQEQFTGITVRYGTDVNAVGFICDSRVAPAADHRVQQATPPPVHAKLYEPIHRLKIAPHPVAPVSAFGGKWETVTDQNGHFELKLGTTGDGTASGPGGVVSVPMNVSGIFTNTDGAHDYDGTIGGVVQPNTRQLIYTFTQKNGQSGGGTFTLSEDGNSLTGEGVSNGTHFTWNGQRAP